MDEKHYFVSRAMCSNCIKTNALPGQFPNHHHHPNSPMLGEIQPITQNGPTTPSRFDGIKKESNFKSDSETPRPDVARLDATWTSMKKKTEKCWYDKKAH
jgi:hypothetical protein